MANLGAATGAPFKSELSGARERFLAQVLVHTFDDGWRTPEDFLREFQPTTIMEALADADALRARILVEAAGVHEKLAQKKSIRSAGEDLSLALEEGVTDAAAILDIFTPDDRVRYLPAEALWGFVTAGEFWKTRAQDSAHKRAAARMTFILERALAENLITLKDFADGVSFEEIAERLPVAELKKLLAHAMKRARSGEALTEVVLTEAVPLPALVGYIPLENVWRGVVVERVAVPLGFSKAGSAPRASARAPSPPLGSPPVEAAPRSSDAGDAAIDVDVQDLEFDGGAPEAVVERPAFEEDSRNKAIENLREIERLPPGHAELSLPILLSIESMYAELLDAGSDDQRETIIRESFPNEAHLRTAMLALIELLDPSINTAEPLIRDADVDSLIKIVLFEERHRYEQAHNQRSGPPPRGRSVPPPLPGRD